MAIETYKQIATEMFGWGEEEILQYCVCEFFETPENFECIGCEDCWERVAE